ncbi:hypothetical protein LI177_02945 [bacterium 210820-DFI.6.37]|nr:hypothetical protein [bacterium 210820-DFI.6.37]
MTVLLDPKRYDLAIKQLQQALESNTTIIKKQTNLVSVIQQDIGDFKSVVADEVTAITGEFEIIRADIADFNVVVTNKIVASEAQIDTISGELSSYKEYVGEKFTGIEADFETLNTNMLTAEKANLLYANIGDFTAISGRVGTLEGNFSSFVSGEFGDLSAGVADIKTLLFGNAAGTTLTTEFANSVVSNIGTAQITSGMIKDLAFDKITGFDVNTTNVTVHSNDGKSQWKDNTIQISDAERVRVQIGKDASGDYSMYVWDAEGKLMFDALGLTDSGIQREIIRNDMVAADAAIDGSKINIQTLVQEIDSSTYTFAANHLTYDGQALDLFLGAMSGTITEQGSTLSSQGTQITAIQGKLDSKIWQQDIDTATGEMNTQYSTLEQALNSFKTSVGETYYTKADATALSDMATAAQTAADNAATAAQTAQSKANAAQTAADEAKTAASNADAVAQAAQKDLDTAKANLTAVTSRVDATEEDIAAAQTAVNAAQAAADKAKTDAASANSAAAAAQSTADTAKANAATAQTAATNAKTAADNAKAAADAAQESADTAQAGVNSLAPRVTAAETKIEQNANAIALRATKTEVTEAVNAIEVGGRNLLKDSTAFYLTNSEYASITTRENGKVTITGAGNFNAYAWFHTKLSVDTSDLLVPGEWVTIGADIKATGATAVRFGFNIRPASGNTGIVHSSILIDSDVGWKRYSVSYQIKEADVEKVRFLAFLSHTTGTADNTGAIIEYKNWKFEKGNKATDWSPAPEDVEAEITSVNSAVAELTVSVDGISSKVSKNETDLSGLTTRMSAAEQKITAEAIISTVSGTYATKTDLSTTNSNVSAAASAAAAAQSTANSANSAAAAAQSSIDNLEIGGRNYILNSANLSASGLGSAAGSRKEFQEINVGQSYMSIPDGTEMTMSFDLEMTVNTANPSLLVYNTNRKGPKQVATKTLRFTAEAGTTIKKRCSVQTTIIDRTDATLSYNTIEFYSTYGSSNWFSISKLKLEIGNKATDCTPAPEDVETEITSVKTIAEQTSEKFSWLVKSGTSATNFTLTDRMAELTADLITLNTKDLTVKVGNVETIANAAQSTANSANSAAAAAQSTADTAKTDAATANSAAAAAQSTADTAKTNAATALNRATYQYGTCSTAAATAAKVVTLSGFTLYTGATITVRFTYGNTATAPTLNVNSTGAKTIVSGGATSVNSNYTWSTAYSTISFVYDGTYWRMINDEAYLKAANAAKVATNYMKFSGNGLVIGDMTASTLGRNVLIDSDSVDIRNGDTVLASYGENYIYLGKNNTSAIIDICNGTAQLRNENDIEGEDWHRLSIYSRDSVGLESMGTISMDTYYENTSGDAGSGIFRMTSAEPWNSDAVDTTILLASQFIDSSGQTNSEIQLTPDKIKLQQLHSDDSADNDTSIVLNTLRSGRVNYDDDFSGPLRASNIELNANMVQLRSHLVFSQLGGKVYGYNTGGSNKECFVPQNEANNTVVGYGNYELSNGNTNIYGNDIGIYSAAAGSSVRPYFRKGDVITYSTQLYTTGWITSSSEKIYFTVPLSRPIIGVSTVTVASVDGFVLRQRGSGTGGVYTHGSASGTYVKPSSYTAVLLPNGQAVRIIATRTTVTNAVNNSPIGIQWSGKITFS